MTKQKTDSALLALAKEKLEDLTEAECFFFNAVASGAVADYCTEEDVATNPADRACAGDCIERGWQT
jgi:hypothetical protein